MDGSGPGEAGVIAWCNTIRYTLANDPGRQFLDMQFQKHGFDFLDSYLDNVLSRAKEDKPMYELLKTPGKKKDAPKRTRAATAAAAKIKALNTAALEEESPPEHSSQETSLPSKKDEGSARPHRAVDKGASHVKRKAQRVVTIVDTPEPPKPAKMDLDEEDAPDPDENAPPSPTPAPTIKKLRSPPNVPVEVPVTTPAPREQRRSPEQIPLAQVPSEPAHAPEPHVLENIVAESVDDVEPVDDGDVGLGQDDMSIVEEAEDEDVQMHTASSKELSMIMEGDENGENSRLSALPPVAIPPPHPKPLDDHDAVPLFDVPVDPLDQDMTVPLRDGPSNPSLKRKPSVTGLSGLPAPSPLRKSMRMSREPSMGAGLLGVPQAHTPGAGLAGGKRTSWLTKAKEVKALELTGPGKRVAGLGAGRLGFVPRSGTPTNTQEGEKSKSNSGLFGLGITASGSTDTVDNQSPLEEKGPESEALAFIKKRKAASSEDITGKFSFAQATRGQSSLPGNDITVPISEGEGEQGELHKLRQTVDDARTGKTLGKSLGGHAAAELAAARARAEAKVAQRNKEEGGGGGHDDDDDAMDIDDDGAVEAMVANEQVKSALRQVDETRRLSVSDLVGVSGSNAAKDPSPKASSRPDVEDTSTSTTPPNSPPPAISKPVAPEPTPVFSKPPPVFAPPPRSPARPPPQTAVARASPPSTFANDMFKLPTTNPFSLPATTLGVGASLYSPKSKQSSVLSEQSSKASLFSDGIFDEKDTIPPWVPPTQDTDYSLHNPQGSQPIDDLDDDDDSWHMDDKFKSNQAWTPFGFGSAERDDTMTWSTLPSRSTSQKGGDTGPVYATATQNFAGDDIQKAANAALAQHVAPVQEPREHETMPDVETVDQDAHRPPPETDEQDFGQDDMDIDDDYPEVDTELEDIVAAGKSTISLVKQPTAPRAPSQQSMASTSSSQSQLGFLGQAGRLVTSVWGGNKGKAKTKTEPVKSIARAAAAAKKQQEEADKKAARMKEMETRRLQAQQRKMEEEKARAQEEERKLREEAERRKREREDQTDKRPIQSTLKKPEDDTTKKRKLNPDAEKKAEPTKPPSKDSQPARSIKPPSASMNASSTVPRPGSTLKSALSKQPSSSSLAASAAAGPSKVPASETKAGKIPTSKLGAMKGKSKPQDKDEAQPSQLLQGQMANRAKAQMQSQSKEPPPVTSESIELPDINSEYSDSDDEDRPRSFNPPEWAQSPELRQQLEQQSLMNPDDVFGPIGPLRMEEIFRTRQSRFRARTSSANWAGTDQLTAEEEREYARRMGFK